MSENKILSRRSILKATLAAGAVTMAAPMINRGEYQAFAASTTKYSKRVMRLVERSTVIDMLAPVSINDEQWARWKTREGMTKADIDMFKNSGVTVMHHSYGLGGPTVFTDTLTFMADAASFVARYSDHFTLVTTPAEIDAAKKAKKVGVIIGVQNSDHFRTPDDVKLFYDLGQRCSQLTYNSQNFIGSGSTDRVDGGISDYGVEIIKAMNAINMLVDVSHCGDKTTMDAAELSSTPIAITHSNCRALANHPRLKTDEAIKKVTSKGGVMGITGVRMFVTEKEPTTLDNIIDHIDHVVKLAGIDHVGIGSDADLNGYDDMPPASLKALRASYKSSYAFRDQLDIDGFNTPQKFFDLTAGLVRRGYSDDNIVAILGGNFRRLLGQIWG